MKRWEYTALPVQDSKKTETVSLLNVAGDLGWEFTGYAVDTGYGISYLMKREKTNG